MTGLGRPVGWTGCRTRSPAVSRSMRRSDAQLGARHTTSDLSPPFGPSGAPGDCVPELRAPSRVGDPAALSAGGPQGRSREVTSYLSVRCDSVAAGPADSELGILSHPEGGKKDAWAGAGDGWRKWGKLVAFCRISHHVLK